MLLEDSRNLLGCSYFANLYVGEKTLDIINNADADDDHRYHYVSKEFIYFLN